LKVIPASPATIIVHDYHQARAAIGFSPALTIVSAPYLATFAGVGFLRELEQALDRTIIADCGDDAGLVMAALRTGLREILFTGDERLRQPLQEMAQAVGGRFRFALEPPVIRLDPGEDPVPRLQRMPG
jgi:hypothetical protein